MQRREYTTYHQITKEPLFDTVIITPEPMESLSEFNEIRKNGIGDGFELSSNFPCKLIFNRYYHL